VRQIDERWPSIRTIMDTGLSVYSQPGWSPLARTSPAVGHEVALAGEMHELDLQEPIYEGTQL
jgi:hypothetical protein